MEKYKAQIKDLENRLSASALKISQDESKSDDTNHIQLEDILKQRTDELEKLRKDQEDLLELLTDQDNKITMYKERLLSLGEKVLYNII